MGSYWSHDIKETGVKSDEKFYDPHTGYKPWVRFQYCKKSIERYYNRSTPSF